LFYIEWLNYIVILSFWRLFKIYHFPEFNLYKNKTYLKCLEFSFFKN